MADRVAKLRIFNDSEGKMNLALADLDPPGAVLAVSNFTVYGETAKNRRPSFIESAPYDRGRELYEAFIASLRALGVHTEAGVFGAHMEVEMVNDGGDGDSGYIGVGVERRLAGSSIRNASLPLRADHTWRFPALLSAVKANVSQRPLRVRAVESSWISCVGRVFFPDVIVRRTVLFAALSP